MGQKLYIDTSIIGGCFDDIFEQHSKLLIEQIKATKYEAYISGITLDELERAPLNVTDEYLKLKPYISILTLNSKARKLANKYITDGKFSSKFLADMQQIALATVHDIDVIASWNFKHMVNPDRVFVYNSINERAGYKPIQICSPSMLLADNEE